MEKRTTSAVVFIERDMDSSSCVRVAAALQPTMLHPQDAFGVAVRDLLAVRVADRELFQELYAGRVRFKRPIDREQDVVRAEREQRAQERGLVPVSAGGDEHVVLQVLKRRFFQPSLGGRAIGMVVQAM